MGSPGEAARQIVVGADGSASAERALRWAAREAGRRGTSLQLVNVGQHGAREASQHLLERARSTVHRAGGDDLDVSLRPLEGDAAKVLVEASADAVLLVVGTRGRGALVEAVLGSVAAKCAHHSTVPVAVIGVEGPDAPPTKIVVGLETSEGSRRALRWALAEAALTGAEVHVVHGWQISEPAPDDAGLLEGPVFTGPTRAVLEGIIAEETKHLSDLSPVTLVAESSPPGELLVDRAADADLLVVGSRGHSGLVTLLVGSVSQHCLHHAPCPLIVVPGPHH